MLFKAKVKNTPEHVKRWVVARRDSYTAELWFYESYDEEQRAHDIAEELDDAIVLESVAE